jgi:hypothetical protein
MSRCIDAHARLQFSENSGEIRPMLTYSTHIQTIPDQAGVPESCSNIDLKSVYNIFGIRGRKMCAIHGVRRYIAYCNWA